MGYIAFLGPEDVQFIEYIGGGFQYFLFSPLPGEMIQFDSYFSNGLKPPTRFIVGMCFKAFLLGDLEFLIVFFPCFFSTCCFAYMLRYNLELPPTQ